MVEELIMTLESRLNRIETMRNGGRKVCSQCGRMPNGSFPPNASDEVRNRVLKHEDGTTMVRCTACGVQLMFQFIVDSRFVPSLESLQKYSGSSGTFTFVVPPERDESESEQ